METQDLEGLNRNVSETDFMGRRRKVVSFGSTGSSAVT